ncbi:MAG: 1,2-phenylacetyl-CoA epoxidase subunit PaaC [Casimicrobium sp.]
MPTSHLKHEDALLTVADTCLIAGHRFSEWCGHGPALEEDISLTNTALDAIGQARSIYQIVAARRTPKTTEDALAYFRDASEFRSITLAEAPEPDYAHTVLKSFLLAAWFVPLWDALARGTDRDVATAAVNAAKEARVQQRHAAEWVVRFGDGTTESRNRLDVAVGALWPLCAQLLALEIGETDSALRTVAWKRAVSATFSEATLPLPAWPVAAAAVPSTKEQETRRALLAEMQSLARQHPGATW